MPEVNKRRSLRGARRFGKPGTLVELFFMKMVLNVSYLSPDSVAHWVRAWTLSLRLWYRVPFTLDPFFCFCFFYATIFFNIYFIWLRTR